MSSLHLESLPMHHTTPKCSIYNDKVGKIIFFRFPLRFSIQEKDKNFSAKNSKNWLKIGKSQDNSVTLTMVLALGDNVFMY